MEMSESDVAALLEALQAQDYALLPPLSGAIDRTSVLEALQGRERWQPEFPEFENDTMGRSFSQNKVSWLDDAEDHLAAICKENWALPAQGIKVEARVLQDRLLFREQRKVCILHIVGGAEHGTLILHRAGLDTPVQCEDGGRGDGMTLVFRHDIYDYSFEPSKDQHALQLWLLKDPPPGEKPILVDPKESKGMIPMGSHSCFGDFPDDYLPEGVKQKLRDAQRARRGRLPVAAARTALLPRIQSAPTFTMTTRPVQGFSWNPHLPPDGPPHAGARKRQVVPSSQFRNFYDRGDLPCCILHGSVGGKITWKVDLDRLDYHHFLPIFFEGLREKEDPYRFLAVTGTYDIGDMIGEALVPYYRQILPTFSLYIEKNKNLGHLIDYAQRKRLNLGELIHETLEIMEAHGGEDAFINIKYMIPTYESCSKA
eukprot:g23105.t1